MAKPTTWVCGGARKSTLSRHCEQWPPIAGESCEVEASDGAASTCSQTGALGATLGMAPLNALEHTACRSAASRLAAAWNAYDTLGASAVKSTSHTASHTTHGRCSGDLRGVGKRVTAQTTEAVSDNYSTYRTNCWVALLSDCSSLRTSASSACNCRTSEVPEREDSPDLPQRAARWVVLMTWMGLIAFTSFFPN